MTAVSQRIPNLIGGVSEQPDSLKLPGQMRTCTNFYPDPTFGLSKRPGIHGIKNLSNSFVGGSWFTIIRDEEERYVCQIDKGGAGIRVWDADSGIEQAVNVIAQPDLDYLVHDQDADLSVLQINDFVFVLNRTVVVRELTTTTPDQDPWAFAVINAVGYNTTYRITIDGTTFSYTSPSTVATGTQPQLSATDIVAALRTSINNNANYTATAIGRYIYIKRTDGNNFDIESSGGQAGNAIETYKGSVPTAADLPISFVNGIKIRVLPDPQSDGDAYWLEFKTESGGNQGSGTWEETVAPGVIEGLDPVTMPHALIREADGTFTFRSLNETDAGAATTDTTLTGVAETVSVVSNAKGRYSIGQTFPVYGGSGTNLRLRVTGINSDGRVTAVSPSRGGRDYVAQDIVTSLDGDEFEIDTVTTIVQVIDNLGVKFWEGRQAGDEETNPAPSFVDQRISGLSFFKNRLVLMSGENVICSEAGQFFNFYASTMITFIDSDPIDLSCGSLRPIILKHSLQTPTGLVLFAENAQYILQTTTDAFSASTAEVNLISSYSQSPDVEPVDMGPTLVFLEQSKTGTMVYEMLSSTAGLERGTPLVAELTRIVPSYVPADVKLLRGTSSASTFGILSRREPDALYLFRFFNSGNERQFASWFKWKMPGEVIMFEFDHDTLYVVIKLNDNDSQYVLGQVNLLTESPGGALRYDDSFIDVRYDIFDYNPTLIYDQANDVTKVCFKEGFHDLTGNLIPEAMLLEDDDSGIRFLGPIVEDLGEPLGEQYFLEVSGDITSERVCLGYRYVAEALMPSFYVESDGRKDTLNVPTLHRVLLDSYNSGPFEVSVSSIGRPAYDVVLPQIFANQSLLNILPIIRNAQNRVGVMAKGDLTEITVRCPFPFPVSLTSLTWEGTYTNKGLRSL